MRITIAPPSSRRYRRHGIAAGATLVALGTVAVVAGRAVTPLVNATGPRSPVLGTAEPPSWAVGDGPPVAIRGTILVDDEPAAATVHVRIALPDPRVWRGLDLATDDAGRFDTGPLPPGRYQVSARTATGASRVAVRNETATRLAEAMGDSPSWVFETREDRRLSAGCQRPPLIDAL